MRLPIERGQLGVGEAGLRLDHVREAGPACRIARGLELGPLPCEGEENLACPLSLAVVHLVVGKRCLQLGPQGASRVLALGAGLLRG